MAIVLSNASKEKLDRLCQAKGMSQNDVINLLIAAIDDIELMEMQTEHIRTGAVKPRSVIVQSRARWQIRP